MRQTVTEFERLRERIVAAQLPNGLRAYVLPKPGFATRYATFATAYGSNDQDFHGRDGKLRTTPAGIAHFLEHKLFEAEEGNVSDRFAALGAMANAFTNYISTTYLFSTSDRFQEALELLLTFVQHPYFTEESVRKEQGIIEQELRMYADDPRSAVFQQLMQSMYRAHPVRVDIGGTVESIYRITADDLHDCYRNFYDPANMVFFAAGDVDPNAVLETVGRLVPGGNPSPPIGRVRPEEPREVVQEIARRSMPVLVPLFELGYKDVPDRDHPVRRETVMGVLLDVLFGPASDIYQTLYDEGLISERFSASYFSGNDFAATVMGGPTHDPDRLLTRLQHLISAKLHQGIDEESVERSRRKAIGEFVSLFNSPEGVAHAFGEYALRGLDFIEVLAEVEALSHDDVEQRLHEQFAEGNWSVSIIEAAV